MPETPDASLRMDAEVYRQLREGELKAQDAFFSGAIEVEGDMQLAISLALAAGLAAALLAAHAIIGARPLAKLPDPPAMLVVFIAELGDKTMLATATLASTQSPVLVWVGATAGIFLAGSRHWPFPEALFFLVDPLVTVVTVATQAPPVPRAENRISRSGLLGDPETSLEGGAVVNEP